MSAPKYTDDDRPKSDKNLENGIVLVKVIQSSPKMMTQAGPMATLPPTRGRRRRDTANEAHPSKAKAVSSSRLPSWCSRLRKESLDSERAYDERVTTSTKTSEVRLRQESVRYWNRFLEEAEVAAFDHIVTPTCHQIHDILSGDFGEDDGEGCGNNQRQRDDAKMDSSRDGGDPGTKFSSMELGKKQKFLNDDIDMNGIDDLDAMKNDTSDDGDWEYCKQMFGLPSSSISASTPTSTSTNQETKPEKLSTDQNSARLCYPFEALPVLVITSPLISNCLQDRAKICHSMWRQLNGLEATAVSGQSSSSKEDCVGLQKFSDRNRIDRDQKTICLYLPRLLSSLTETLQVIWDGLLSHYENTHDAPSMDPDDPNYYSNPNDLASKRHSYHVSKRRHYEALVDRKVTTESQKSKIGTKKQQSLQDFILEFLQFIYEEPEDFLKQESQQKNLEDLSSTIMKTEDSGENSRRKRSRRGKLILLLEDPRIIHSKVVTATTTMGTTSIPSSGGKSNNSNLVQSQLLETLAAWRETHGVPVSLVVFHSVGSKREIQENNVLLNPSFESSVNGGRFGLRVSRFSIPSADVNSYGTSIPSSMAYGLWSRHFLQATINSPLPLLAPQRPLGHENIQSTATEIVLRMFRDAFHNESSCSKWVSSIRARLVSNFYAQKGSFVWDALNPYAASMMRNTSLVSERSKKRSRNITANTDVNNNNGIDKDRKPFEVGNDDVQIFQPGFVAWFCSYHKAHSLLSSQVGDHKPGMVLSEKCEALLKCYRLLCKPNDATNYLEKPSKRQKLSNGQSRGVEERSGGILQFWWSISCSLLPLYFLWITVPEQDIVCSTSSSSNHSAANGNSNMQDDCLLEGGSKWVLNQLAAVSKQLSARLSETETSTVDGKKTSEETHEIPGDEGIDFGYVEATLKRYLQRGNKEDATDKRDGDDRLPSSDDLVNVKEVQQQTIKKLKAMVQELIVLTAALSTNQNHSSLFNTENEDEMTRSDKIRLGIKESILEMNVFTLSQIEELTRQWMDFNPLMAYEFARENQIESELFTAESRPVNFRRRILENLPTGSRELYEALEGRLSIDRDEWYNCFNGTIEDFVIGVCTLRKCGLIRPKKMVTVQKQGKARKRQEVLSYEKNAVVWC